MIGGGARGQHGRQARQAKEHGGARNLGKALACRAQLGCSLRRSKQTGVRAAKLPSASDGKQKLEREHRQVQRAG